MIAASSLVRLLPAQAASIGESRRLPVCRPTQFPEGVLVHGSQVFVSGPARFGTAGTGPSAIQNYNRKSGALVQTITVVGEALEYEHALSNMAVDASGRIYALSTQWV